MTVYRHGGELPQPLPAFPRHGHEHWELVCYVEGSGVLTVGREPIPFRPGLVVALPPNIPHQEDAVGKGFRCLYVGYNDRAAGRPVAGQDHEGAMEALIRLAIVEDRRRNPQWQSIADDCLSAVLRLLRRAAGETQDPILARVEATLHAAVGDHDFRITDLARDLGLSNDRLTRRYRAATGMSPRARLTALRMAEARALLARGLGVAEAAAMVGFGDPFWFSRQFHQHFGVAPRVARQH